MNKMRDKGKCEHDNTRITLSGLWQCLECGAMLDERPNITRGKSRNSITEEIRKVFIHYKRNNPSETIEDAAPFTGDQLWMNYYLFPEVLQIYDEWAEEYKVFNLVARSGEAIIFPCWVLTNKVVLRVMEECGIILREEN